MIWDEFLRHFRFCDEEDSGLSDEEQGAERTKKSPKAHTKTDTSSQEKLFGEIQNSFLVQGASIFIYSLYLPIAKKNFYKCPYVAKLLVRTHRGHSLNFLREQF